MIVISSGGLFGGRKVMIDVKQAVANAAGFLRETFEENEVRDVRLEEVELSADDKYWNITLSFVKRGYVRVPSLPEREAARYGVPWDPPDDPREYKQFQVDVADGKVRSMKIRQLS
jgi:hypothetical protein